MITTLGTPESGLTPGLSASMSDYEAYQRLEELERGLRALEETTLYCTPSKITARGQRWIEFGEKLIAFFEEIGKSPLPVSPAVSRIRRFEEECKVGAVEGSQLELTKSSYRNALNTLWDNFPNISRFSDPPEPPEPDPPPETPPESPPSDDGNSPPPDEAGSSLPLPLLLGGSMAAGAALLWWQANRGGDGSKDSE